MRVVGGADPYGGKQALYCRREDGERGGALLIHRSAVPLSRCGSGTLGLFHSPGVKFSPLVPLRDQQEKAKVR